MAGQFDIQRVAGPLLRVLGIYGLGPQAIEDKVRGTLDLSQFYAMATPRSFALNDIALVPGGGLVTVVPPTETWMVRGASISAVMPAGLTEFWGQIYVTSQGGTIYVASGSGPAAAGASVGAAAVCHWLPTFPWILNPGDSIGMDLAVLTGVANANVALRIFVGVFG